MQIQSNVKTYKPLNQPLITMVARRFELEFGPPFGYVAFWKLDHLFATYYARWWLAPFLWVLMDFSLYWDKMDILMRLDAPEFIREWEGYPMPAPFSGWASRKINQWMEPLMVRRVE